ncbi:hypothetical protein D915_010572 [Fasciola hepatica]|uniref:Uncharacterized protein n=1 Tax=Fasciola hepatica TaxID=6192 RepID=A0A4E0QU42_FASHE|nr:hypothetical protein D915_010572 [Fasciola hepatica]
MFVPSEAQAGSRPTTVELTNYSPKTRMSQYSFPRVAVHFSSNYACSGYSCDFHTTPAIQVTMQTVKSVFCHT